MPLKYKGLKLLIDKLAPSVNAFEKTIGAKQSRIDKALKRKEGESDVSLDVVQMILDAYPSVNPDYLKSGTLPLLLSDDKEPRISARNARPAGSPVDLHQTKNGNTFIELSEGDYIMFARRVTIKARASYAVGWGDLEYIESLPVYPAKVKEIHKGHYLWFDVDGDSMVDGTMKSIPAGSVVLGRQIQRSLWQSKFHYNEYPNFVIVHKEHGIMLKRMIDHDVENGVITLHSLNPNKHQFPDFTVNLDDCMQIFNVVKIERDGAE